MQKEELQAPGTFFAEAKLSLYKALQFFYLWLSRTKVSTIQSINGLSSATLADYGRYARQLVMNAIDESIVEVDESKFSRRKYKRGHHVASKKWIFGGIERTPERKFFAIVVDGQSTETL